MAIGPASLGATVATGAGSSVLGNSLTRTLNEEQLSAGSLATDAAVGGAGGALGYGVAKGLSSAAPKIGSALSSASKKILGGKNTAALASFTRENFRTNLSRLTGKTPSNSHAHHVFPKEFSNKFKAAGIDVHNPKYGTWWKAGSHVKNAHGYNSQWRSFIDSGGLSRGRAAILNEGREIMKGYGQKVKF